MRRRWIAPIFTIYMIRRFLGGLLLVYAPVIVMIYLIDLLELTRRAGRASDRSIDAMTVIAMSALKLPGLAITVLPFVCLFGAMWTFTRLSRTNELTIARAAGLSVWQFLSPALMVALAAGIFAVTIINPWSAALNERYRQLEAYYIKETTSSLSTVTESGLWLRQADPDSSAIIHAQTATNHGFTLTKVVVFVFGAHDQFVRRIEAADATYQGDHWTLTDARIVEPDKQPVPVKTYTLSTNMRPEDILQNLANPDTISFWALPAYAARLEAAGFTANRYRLYWQSLAATPILLCAMVLIAATVSLRQSRRGEVGGLIGLGVLAGFALYVATNIARALGIAESVPVILAAWGPAIAAVLAGGTLLLHLEDG